MMSTSLEIEDTVQALAFLGNSLLRPMSFTGDYGIEADFWESFPDFEQESLSLVLAEMAAYVRTLDISDSSMRDKAVSRVSVEFAKLFIGPPRPCAHPWETFYKGEKVRSGYGQPAIEMHKELSNLQLAIGGSGNTFPDHMGIELLCLAAIIERSTTDLEYAARTKTFCDERPRSWVGDFHDAVRANAQGGYYDHLLAIIRALLEFISSK